MYTYSSFLSPPFHFLKLPPETGNGTNKRRGDGGVGVRPIGASFKRAVRGVAVSPENACARASTTGGRGGFSTHRHTHTPLDTTHALPITIFRCYRLTPPPPPTHSTHSERVYKRKMRDVGERQCRPTEKTLLIRIISPLEQSSHFEVGWSGGGSYKNITHEPNEKERRNSESNVNKKEKKKYHEKKTFWIRAHIFQNDKNVLCFFLFKKFLGFLSGGGLK